MKITIKNMNDIFPVRFQKLYGFDKSLHLRPIVKFVDLS